MFLQNTGLFYDAYLQEVVKLLESNENFKQKMQSADFEDIKVCFIYPVLNLFVCFVFKNFFGHVIKVIQTLEILDVNSSLQH